MKAIIIGGGAAGFFLAINLKAMCPALDVTIAERSVKFLAKVEVSGGGRCNCTNTFEGVTDLADVYPRGHRLLRKLFCTFGPADARRWFEERGVPLVAQPDHCIFPASQQSLSIIKCLVGEADRLGVRICTSKRIVSLDDVADYDLVAVTTGGSPNPRGLDWLGLDEADIVPPVPSLFSLAVADEGLHDLMGVVAPDATISLASTSFRASGAMLITHWGVSGPAALKLSSHAARHLAEAGYKATMCVNWLSLSEDEARALLKSLAEANKNKMLSNTHPDNMTSRLWGFLLTRSLGEQVAQKRWSEVGKKEMNRLVAALTADTYQVSGRAPFRDEFVTCGGVSLKCVDSKTLECKRRPGLFFAGEVLDIDGVTGGFNFQAAWTTAFVAAKAMAAKAMAAEG